MQLSQQQFSVIDRYFDEGRKPTQKGVFLNVEKYEKTMARQEMVTAALKSVLGGTPLWLLHSEKYVLNFVNSTCSFAEPSRTCVVVLQFSNIRH